MEELLKNTIRDIPDFPKKGIIFKDITPVLKDAAVFRRLIDYFAERYEGRGIDSIVCVEARGFILGAALAYKIGASFVPARKPGKLPADTYRVDYDLEYGADAVELHKDAIKKGEKVLLIDDLLATGGTAAAAAKIVEQAGGEVEEIAFIIELDFLKGRQKLSGYEIFSIVHY